MSTRFLAADAVAPWLAGVAQSRRVLAPRQEGRAVIFRLWTEADGAPRFARATVSPKAAVFPSSETLFTYSGTKDPEKPGTVNMTLEAPTSAQPTLLFGCRPCDARGLLALDHAYLGGRFVDPYYAARREALLVCVLTCQAPDATCFCTSVGGSPVSTEGADLLMTPVEGGLVLDAVSLKGAAFLDAQDLPDGQPYAEAVSKAHSDALAAAPEVLDLSAASERLKARFTDTAFWEDATGRCLSCGACTYICPTCQCFTITDEGDAHQGRRLRSQDNCMAPLFTREASGHNPRQIKGARMRNRVSHKFWYAPEYSEGRFACTGCGRCVALCPVSLDIRELVLKAIAE